MDSSAGAPCPAELFETLERCWYLYAALCVPVYYAMRGCERGALIRPSWCLAGCLRLLAARPVRWTCLLVATVCAASEAGFGGQPATRLLFAVAVAVPDLYVYSRSQLHTGFALLYVAWALCLPGAAARRTAVGWIAAHQLASSAMLKLDIGGRKWLTAETIAQTLKDSLAGCSSTSRGLVMLKQKWLINALLRRPLALSLLAWGSLLAELFAIPVGVVFPQLRLLVLIVVCGFHIMVLALHSLLFEWSIPCYALALWPARDCMCLDPVGLLVCAPLVLSTVWRMESWPLNAMPVFPYNHEQVTYLQSLLGKFRLIGDEDGARSDAKAAGPAEHLLANEAEQPAGISLVALLLGGAFPSIYHPELCACLGLRPSGCGLWPAPLPELSAETHDEIAARLAEWLRTKQPLLSPRTFEPLRALDYQGGVN